MFLFLLKSQTLFFFIINRYQLQNHLLCKFSICCLFCFTPRKHVWKLFFISEINILSLCLKIRGLLYLFHDHFDSQIYSTNDFCPWTYWCLIKYAASFFMKNYQQKQNVQKELHFTFKKIKIKMSNISVIAEREFAGLENRFPLRFKGLKYKINLRFVSFRKLCQIEVGLDSLQQQKMKAILLSVLLLVLVTSPPPASSTFTLSFEYAARLQTSLQTCLADVIWNDVIILSVVPTDYDIHTATITVTAVVGKNILQFEGAGVSDSVGLGITNVALVRQGDSINTNILVNGDFSQPSQGKSFNNYDDILGWNGSQIEVGFGKIYNAWPNGIQVCELDSDSNFEITQILTFDSNFQVISSPPAPCLPSKLFSTPQFILRFDWAPNTVGTDDLLTSQANILFNNVVIGSIVPDNTTNGVNIDAAFAFYYDPCRQNILQIDGTQKGDGFGISISNIRITEAGIQITANDWIAVNPEYADCQTFNTAWSTGRCLSLDSGTNQRYSQLIIYNQKAFDIVGPLTLTAFACLFNQGYSHAIVRASSNAPGVIDPNAIQTVVNALVTGIKTDIYLVVCPSSNFVNQLSAVLSSMPTFRLFSIVWLKIIQNTPGCSWQTYTNTTANCASLGELVNMVSKQNSVGFFSTKNIWNRVFGTTCTEYGSIAYLWYADYQANGKVDPTESFSDFTAYGGFGGWTQPDLKTTVGTTHVTLCNNPAWHALISIDWHP